MLDGCPSRQPLRSHRVSECFNQDASLQVRGMPSCYVSNRTGCLITNNNAAAAPTPAPQLRSGSGRAGERWGVPKICSCLGEVCPAHKPWELWGNASRNAS